MTNTRAIAFDATYMILYIGSAGAMFTLSIALIAYYAIHGELGQTLSMAAALNLAGWIVLPFAPSFYRSFTGHPFRWTSNEAFGVTV